MFLTQPCDRFEGQPLPHLQATQRQVLACGCLAAWLRGVIAGVAWAAAWSHTEGRSLDEEESAAIVVGQPEGNVRGEMVAQAHNHRCDQRILLGPLEATT